MKKLLLILLCLSCVGCVTPTTQRGVIDNQVFYSTGIPEMKVKVTEKPDRFFTCTKQRPGGGGNCTLKDEQYLFLKLSDKHIKSGVLIEHVNISSGRWLPDAMYWVKNEFKSGKTMVDGKMFQHSIAYMPSTKIITGGVLAKLENTDIIIPNHLYAKAFGRIVGVDKRVKVYVIYFENLSLTGGDQYSYGDWKNKTLLDDSQKRTLKEVEKRADKAFTISHQLNPQEPTVTVQTDPIQSKLNLLKQSHEADLITKEEYIAKKKELLDAL